MGLLTPKGFMRNVSPRGAIADLIHEWKAPTPHRWQILGVSVAATFTMMMLFLPESERKPPEKPVVTWITTFAPGRTDAEIEASNRANQERQDVVRAEQARLEERRKELYRELGRATGVDVDAMEEQIRREQAAEDAAKAAGRPAPAPAASGR